MDGKELAREAGREIPEGEGAERIRDVMHFLRTEQGWTCRDVARALDCTAVSYRERESGREPLTVGFLWALANLHSVPLGVLVAEVPEEDR